MSPFALARVVAIDGVESIQIPCAGVMQAVTCLPLAQAAPHLLEALIELREACEEAYKVGRIPAEPFVRAGNVIAKATA